MARCNIKYNGKSNYYTFEMFNEIVKQQSEVIVFEAFHICTQGLRIKILKEITP